MKGSCWDRFDRKTLLAFTGYKDRTPGVLKELDRIGMKGVNVQWQFPNPFDGVLLKSLRHERSLGEGGFMNATMGHYTAVKTAYHLGCTTCLVVEDDIRFLKDVDEVSKAVEMLPADFDIALFDSILIGLGDQDRDNYRLSRERRRVNDFWAEFDVLHSQGCYAMSRKAMERYIWLNEAAVTDPAIGKLRIGDHFLNRKSFGANARMYFAIRNVAIQQMTGRNNSNTRDPYQWMDLDKSLYQEL